MKLAKNAITCLHEFEEYRGRYPVAAINTSLHNLILIEEPQEFYDGRSKMITHVGANYLAGEVADRLYKYEALGYEPEELAKKLKKLEALENPKLKIEIPPLNTGSFKHRFNRDEIAAIEAALKRDDKAVTFTRTDDEVMVTIAPWSGEEE